MSAQVCSPNQIAKALRKSVESLETDENVATSSQTTLRSAESQFEYSTQCFYCGEPVACGKKRKKYDVASVRTIETKDTILAICQERGDSWANAVQGRLLHVHDLCAADAVYHRACSAP